MRARLGPSQPHIHTMGTDNLVVTDMLWHQPSSSLIASTHNPHSRALSEVGMREYRCGTIVDSDEEEDASDEWPIAQDFFLEPY